MRPLVTAAIHRPDSKTNLPTRFVLTTAPAAAVGPVSEQKSPAAFAGAGRAPTPGSGQWCSERTGATGWAGGCQGRGRYTGAELRCKGSNRKLKRWLVKAITIKELCHMQKAENFFQIYLIRVSLQHFQSCRQSFTSSPCSKGLNSF